MSINNFFKLIIFGFCLLNNSLFATATYYSFKEGINTRVFTPGNLELNNNATPRKTYTLDTKNKIVTITTQVLQNCMITKRHSYQELNPRLHNTKFCDDEKTYTLIDKKNQTMSELTQKKRAQLSFDFGITFEIESNNTLKMVIPDGTIMDEYEIMQNPNKFVRDNSVTVK